MGVFRTALWIFLLLGSCAAWGHGPAACLKDGTLCAGDTAFMKCYGELASGTIRAVNPDGTVEYVTTTDIAYQKTQPRLLASTRATACRAASRSFCPGDGTERTVNQQIRKGLVVAVFPTGDLVVAEAGQKPRILSPALFKKTVPEITNDLELKDIFRQYEFLSGILKEDNSQSGCAQEPDTRHGSCNDDGKAPPLNSPNLTRFRELLKKGLGAPLKDFLILWDPRNQPGNESYFDACEDPKNSGRPIRNSNGYIVEECKPDVLYSWGPIEKIRDMERGMPQNKGWSSRPNPGGSLWATLSPVSTYAYGNWGVRLKLRKDARFRVSDRGERRSDIYVPPGNLNDFYIGSSTVIESWSYGTPEQYDEIVRDLSRLLSGKKFVGYVVQKDYFPNPLANITIMERGILPGEFTLKQELLDMIRMILNREGHIYYAPGTCKNRRLHFTTNRPTYFKRSPSP